jgi:hypothetical protein
MHRFRPLQPNAPAGEPTDLLAVSQLIDDAMQPGHFFAAPELRLAWIAGKAETIPWEVFRGKLLDPAHTRASRSFLSWRLAAPAAEPMLSVKLDVLARQIHVVRGILCYAWEAHGGSVIETRETIKWTRELVGTISLADFADLETLRDELLCLIWQAIVGTSRLPLHSIEAPLPAFTLGQLHYLYRPGAEPPSQVWSDFVARGLEIGLACPERVKLLEFALRTAPRQELPRLVQMAWHDWPRLLRALFNGISLSPPTAFVDRALALVDLLESHGKLTADAKIDFLSWLLRQLGRHLTAYDLVTFHHRGANYPDALLLDAALKAYLREIDRHPQLFHGEPPLTPGPSPPGRGEAPAHRMRRRALRQACLLRRHYEGHRVPDQPTTPGENARVMPASHPRVEEEQLTHPLKRRRRLFDGDPLAGLLSPVARSILAESLRDLEHADEQAELGLGLFIDRPLGYGKALGEPDQTPILAHLAFSRSIARRRLTELKELSGELGLQFGEVGELVCPTGMPHEELAECPRPVAALADVRKVADDFVVVRTLPGGLQRMLGLLGACVSFQVRLCVQLRREDGPVLALLDETMQQRAELRVDAKAGFRTRAGVELPRTTWPEA